MARRYLAWRRGLGLGLVLAATLTAAPGLAQETCAAIENRLRALESSSLLRNLSAVERQIESAQTHVRNLENRYVRAACPAQVERGQVDRMCQELARAVNEAHAARDSLDQQARDGRALAAQRQDLTQAHARNACGSAARSGVTFSDRGPVERERRSLLEDVFGDDTPARERAAPEPRAPAARINQSTRRTMCVRTCDGYYWPVSYSTTDRYLGEDAQACQAQCPGADVELYSYRNPGEGPEQMVSMSGQRYAQQPFAFRYRTERASNCGCAGRTPERVSDLEGPPDAFTDVGRSGRQSEAVIDFARYTVTLPKPDPRGARGAPSRAANATVPLPRPRPQFDEGGTILAQGAPLVEERREYTLNDRRIRVVGPETPYVPKAQEGS